MSRMLLAPGRYVHRSGAVKEIGIPAERIGNCALVMFSKFFVAGLVDALGLRYKKVWR